MKKDNIKEYKDGWIIGNFEPSIIKNSDFEIAIKKYPNNYESQLHLHKYSTEITVIISGSAIINGIKFNVGDIAIIEKNESCKFLATDDNTITLVIKTPSVIGDKIILE